MDYIAECIEIGVEPLEEAGGIFSYLARAYTGKDNDLANEISKEINSLKTAEQKKKLLDEVDDFIKEAEATHVMNSGEFGGVDWPEELKGAIALPGTELFKKRMAWLRIHAHTDTGIFGNGHGQAGLNVTAGLPGTIWKTIAARSGKITAYIDALKQVRTKVAAAKVGE